MIYSMADSFQLNIETLVFWFVGGLFVAYAIYNWKKSYRWVFFVAPPVLLTYSIVVQYSTHIQVTDAISQQKPLVMEGVVEYTSSGNKYLYVNMGAQNIYTLAEYGPCVNLRNIYLDGAAVVIKYAHVNNSRGFKFKCVIEMEILQ